MQEGISKGLRPRLIKQLAMIMSICYLMNPLQQQITSLLHSFSHGLQLQNSILSHEVHSNKTFTYHEQHEHTTLEHQHPLVDFVNSIFEASGENHNANDSQLTEVNWDKHITTHSIRIPDNFQINVSPEFLFSKNFPKKGHLKLRDEPPQHRQQI